MFVPKITSRIMVFNKAGQVLLIKRAPDDDKPDLWDLPGGKMDPEDLGHKKPKKACAKRELEEETGLVVKIHRLKKRGELLHPLKNKLFCLFAVAAHGKTKIELSDEHVDMMWCDPKKLPADINPSTMALIKESDVPFKLAA